MNRMKRMRRKTIESYKDAAQKKLEKLCIHLSKTIELRCAKSGNTIQAHDEVYLDKNGVVLEGHHDRIQSVYLGTLEEFRNWCRKRAIPKSTPSIPVGSIPPLPMEDLRFVVRNLRSA